MTEYSQIQDIVYSIATSSNFAQDGTSFAGCSSGLYRSLDGGLTWCSAYEAADLHPAPTTTAIAISPAFESDRTLFAGVPGGILRSGNDGQTWFFAMLPSPPPVISTLAISPGYVEDGTLLAGTMEDGIYRSEDGGHHWSACNFGLMDLGVLYVAMSPAFKRDNTVFVGTESGIFRSSNGGRAWKEVDFPSEDAPILSLALSPHYAEDGIIWAGTESHGPFYSQDRGQTWEQVATDQTPGPVNAIVLSRHFPDEPKILIMTDQAISISGNEGRAWSSWKEDLDAGQGLTCLAAPLGLDPGVPLLVGMTEGGVKRIEVGRIIS